MKNTAKSKKTWIPRISPNAIFRKNKDGTITIIQTDRDLHYFVINKMAAETWLLIDGKRAPSEIVERISTKHRVNAKDVRTHVDRLLRALMRQQLVVSL